MRILSIRILFLPTLMYQSILELNPNWVELVESCEVIYLSVRLIT